MKKVVVASTQPGKHRNIRSLAEAASFLINEWPSDHLGPTHTRAKLACDAALDGNQSKISARKAFIDAAQEAGIYVQRGPADIFALIERVLPRDMEIP